MYAGWYYWLQRKKIDDAVVILCCAVASFWGQFHGMWLGIVLSSIGLLILVLVWLSARHRWPQAFATHLVAASTSPPSSWWNSFRLLSLLALLAILLDLGWFLWAWNQSR